MHTAQRSPGRLLPTIPVVLTVLLAPLGTGAPTPTCPSLDLFFEPAEPTSAIPLAIVVEVDPSSADLVLQVTTQHGEEEESSAHTLSSDDPIRSLDLGRFAKETHVEAVVEEAGAACEAARAEVLVRNAPPVGALSLLGPSPLHRGDRVVLDAADSMDPDGDAIRVRLALVDGVDTDGLRLEHVLDQVGEFTASLELDDGEASVTVQLPYAVENWVPQIEGLRINPPAVIRNQAFRGAYEAFDGDVDTGFDTLALSHRVGGDFIPDEVSEFTASLSAAGDVPVEVRVDDGLDPQILSTLIEVFDREAPNLGLPDADVGVPILALEPGDGSQEAPTQSGFTIWHTQTYVAGDADDAATLVAAASQTARILVLTEANLPASPALVEALEAAVAAGVTALVPAPAAGQRITGLAALPHVVTIGWTSDGVQLGSAQGPGAGLEAKPDALAQAGNPVDAVRAAAFVFARLQAMGIADPVLARSVAFALAQPLPSMGPSEQGAGVLRSPLPDLVVDLPAVPVTHWMDFGVVNDATPGPADLGLVNLNGYAEPVAKLLGDPNAPLTLPSILFLAQGAQPKVNVESAFFHIGDVVENGLSVATELSESPYAHDFVHGTFQLETVDGLAQPFPPLVRDVRDDAADLLAAIQAQLANNGFGAAPLPNIEDWDSLRAVATVILDAADDLHEQAAPGLEDALDDLSTQAQAACDLLDRDDACAQAQALRASAEEARARLRESLGEASLPAAQSVRVETDPAATGSAPLGLYLGYLLLTTQIRVAQQDGDVVLEHPITIPIPASMILTGTTTVTVRDAAGQPVAGTSAEGLANPCTLDPVGALLASLPNGERTLTGADGSAVLRHLVPSSVWTQAGYYDAGLDLDAAGNPENLPALQSATVGRPLFGPSTTDILSQLLQFDVSCDVGAMIESILGWLWDPPQLNPSIHELLEALRNAPRTERVDITLPLGLSTRFVDDIGGAEWETHTIGGEALPVPGGEDWQWTNEGGFLEGRSTTALTGGLAIYAFPVPDANHLRFTFRVHGTLDTNSVAFLVVTLGNQAQELVRAYLDENVNFGTEPQALGAAEMIQETLMLGLVGGPIRLLPLTNWTAQLVAKNCASAVVIAACEDVHAGALPYQGDATHGETEFERTYALSTEFVTPDGTPSVGHVNLVVIPGSGGEARHAEATICQPVPLPNLPPVVPGVSVGGGCVQVGPYENLIVPAPLPLASHIKVEVGFRALAYRSLDAAPNGDGLTAAWKNRIGEGAEAWDVFLTIPRSHGVEGADAARARPDARGLVAAIPYPVRHYAVFERLDTVNQVALDAWQGFGVQVVHVAGLDPGVLAYVPSQLGAGPLEGWTPYKPGLNVTRAVLPSLVAFVESILGDLRLDSYVFTAVQDPVLASTDGHDWAVMEAAALRNLGPDASIVLPETGDVTPTLRYPVPVAALAPTGDAPQSLVVMDASLLG